MKQIITILSLTIMFTTSAQACLVAISQCKEVPGSLETTDKVVYEYNGEKLTEPVFKATAAFSYAMKVSGTWLRPSRFEYNAEYAQSEWMSSREEAQALAMKKCLFMMSEISETVPRCKLF